MYAAQKKETVVDTIEFSTVKSKLSFEMKCRIVFKDERKFIGLLPVGLIYDPISSVLEHQKE